MAEELSSRSTQEVLDDHLGIAQRWEGEELQVILEEDLRRNVSEDIVILMGGQVFEGHEGVKELAGRLGKELPEHNAFEYTSTAVAGRLALLEWRYEDGSVRVGDGADSYLVEDGKIVAQTIHYTVEEK